MGNIASKMFIGGLFLTNFFVGKRLLKNEGPSMQGQFSFMGWQSSVAVAWWTDYIRNHYLQFLMSSLKIMYN